MLFLVDFGEDGNEEAKSADHSVLGLAAHVVYVVTPKFHSESTPGKETVEKSKK